MDHDCRRNGVFGNIKDARGSAEFLTYQGQQRSGVALADGEVRFGIIIAVLCVQINYCTNSLFYCSNLIIGVHLPLLYGQDWNNLQQCAYKFGRSSNSSAFVQVL